MLDNETQNATEASQGHRLNFCLDHFRGQVTPTPKRVRFEEWPCIHPHAAGMDIGARSIVVAVPPERDAQPVRIFETFSTDLHALVDWLVTCHMGTVAMESTGVSWVPLFELLEQRGLTPYLVNAPHVKPYQAARRTGTMPSGCKKLHALGLLQASCRPDTERCVLRMLLRPRATLVEPRAPHMLNLQNTLTLMSMPLSEVLTDITGVTGQAIARAIVAGERDPV